MRLFSVVPCIVLRVAFTSMLQSGVATHVHRKIAREWDKAVEWIQSCMCQAAAPFFL